jgi:hypothetical protein
VELALLGDEARELVGWTAVGQRAARGEIGDHDARARVQDLRGLGHEVDAAERDHLGVELLGDAGQRERVADVVGEILDDVVLVVVRQHDGVALVLEAFDRVFEAGRFESCDGRHGRTPRG